MPDLLKENLDIVICGVALGNRTAIAGTYYANPSNKLWKTLFQVNLTPLLLHHTQYENLLNYNIGLTDLVQNQHGNDIDIQHTDDDITILKDKILHYKPKLLCFNGKEAAKRFYDTNQVPYGFQSEKLDDIPIYIAASTSGSASRFWNIETWHEVAAYIKRLAI